MDLFDLTDEPRFNVNERRAIRITALATAFANASAPLATARIMHDFYADLSDSNAEKTFQRDRLMLAMTGIHVESVTNAYGEPAWRLSDRSLAQVSALSPSDASVLRLICRRFLGDPSFPYPGELQMALAKIDRSFDAVIPVTPVSVLEPSEELVNLRAAWEAKRAVDVEYVDAKGARSERRIAPYGFFSLSGHLYVVCDGLDEEGRAQNRIRTFRTDRFAKVSKPLDVGYVIPEDFFVDDYRLLPFQIGETQLDISFSVPDEQLDRTRRITLGKGDWSRAESGSVWTVPCSDVDAAVRWAVLNGLVPNAPQSFVDAWRGSLEEVLAHGA
ncbi:MAG: WYL domain-containing protein [Atopobiaceae bacterium]|nr:WYL domain-containing protein [Atopobiaceae bacterium]